MLQYADMGGKSTSRSALLSKQKSQTEDTAFDLRSWQGLTEVLRHGKEVIKDTQEYASFRNIVLEYAQKGGDVEIRKKIDTILTSHTTPPHIHTETEQETPHTPIRVIPENLPVEPEPLPQNDSTPIVITRRLQPRFDTTILTSHHTPVSDTDSVTSPDTNTSPTPTTLVTEVPTQIPTDPYSFDDEIDETTSSTTEEPPHIEQYNKPPEIQQTPAPVFKTIEEHKARIAEIKRTIHEHIGNPAALIDSHNVSGKAYMTALLTALKATSPGSTIGIEGAMTNLEVAFTTLLDEQITPEHTIGTTPQAPTETTTDVIEEPVQPLVEETTEISSEPPLAYVPEPSIPPLPVVETSLPEIQIESNQSVRTPTEHIPTKTVDTNVSKSPYTTHTAAQMIINAEKDTVEQTIKHISLEENTPNQTPITHTPTYSKYIRPPITITENPHIPTQAELYTEEITKTLQQLLNEWSIFRSGGLFGTGPGGFEHPLYRTLAPLIMSEVIGGNWDNTNQKNAKIIKQYVDAWHHEQGVIYTGSETFEHYLRRVIQRILKRQTI